MPTVYKKQSGSWAKHTTWKKLYKKINGEWVLIGDNSDFVYVSEGSRIKKISAEGNVISQLSVSPASRAVLATDPNGNLYVAYIDNSDTSNRVQRLRKYDLNGNIVWTVQLTSFSDSSPVGYLAVSKNGECIAISEGRTRMVCINADGSVRWDVYLLSYLDYGKRMGNIVIHNGYVYIGNAGVVNNGYDGYYAKYSMSNGSRVWERKPADYVCVFAGINKAGDILLLRRPSTSDYYKISHASVNDGAITQTNAITDPQGSPEILNDEFVEYIPDYDYLVVSDSDVAVYERIVNVSTSNPINDESLYWANWYTNFGQYADVRKYFWIIYKDEDTRKAYIKAIDVVASSSKGTAEIDYYTSYNHYYLAANGGRANTMQL